MAQPTKSFCHSDSDLSGEESQAFLKTKLEILQSLCSFSMTASF